MQYNWNIKITKKAVGYYIVCRSANKNRSNADEYTEVKTKTVSVQNVPSLSCLQTCMRKLGPIIYSQDHSALSKLAFLVDSIQKKDVQEKKKKTFKSDDTVLCLWGL